MSAATDSTQLEPPTPRVLLVDDEVGILNSLRRLLRHEEFEVITAESAEAALEILEEKPVELIISDARMPGMDGATLLAKVWEKWPKTIRILLTGFADLNTTVKAINAGRIHRYISKPWDDDDLKETVRQWLQFQTADRERQRLEKLTEQQNAELQKLNDQLEARVKARTSELEQTADMLDLAYIELKRSYETCVEVFSTLLTQRYPLTKQTNKAVISLARHIAENFKMGELEREQLVMAAALYNVGKVSWNDTQIHKSAEVMLKTERPAYQKYPTQGEQLLMALEPIQEATRLIGLHQERWDGSGFPNGWQHEVIPPMARVLKIIVDFVELQCGLLLERVLSRDEALVFLRKYAGRWYDPGWIDRIVPYLEREAPDLLELNPNLRALTTAQVKPGMELAHNLHAASGILLLNRGKILSQPLIEKLAAYETSEKARYTLFVKVNEPVKEANHGQPAAH